MSNLSYLSDHQTFETIEELNEAVAEHLSRYKYDLNETDRDVLVMLSQYSVKYPGVSHLKVATMAEHVGKSTRTVQRALRKLEGLNVIERRPFLRKVSGGYGANIFVITSHVTSEVSHRLEIEKPTPATAEPEEDENEPINSIKHSNTHTRDGKGVEEDVIKDADKRGLRTAIPQVIYGALAPFYDAEGIYNTYGILLRAKAAIDRNITIEEFGDEYVDVFLNAQRLRKLGKVRKSFEGLLYASWERLTAEISRRVNVANGSSSSMSIFKELLSQS